MHCLRTYRRRVHLGRVLGLLAVGLFSTSASAGVVSDADARRFDLSARILSVFPDLGAESLQHASDAIAAERPDVSAELLVAVASVESSFDPQSVSRVGADGKRVAGHWGSKRRPGSGPYFCGILQTEAHTWKQCLAMQDPAVGYLVGAAELSAWLNDSRTHWDVTLALRGYGCGNVGMTGACAAYARKVLRIEQSLLPLEQA